MVATSGFGESYPILLYVYEKDQKEIDFSLGKNLSSEEFYSEKETLISTPRKSKPIRKSRYSEDSRHDRKRSTDKHSAYSEEHSLSRLNKEESGEDLSETL